MASSTNCTWAEHARKLDEFTRKPENFLKPQNDIAEEIKHFVKEFYDFAKSVEEIKPKEALPELIVDNFDDEQVWQQLELQNNEKLNLFVPQVAKLIAKKNKLLFPIQSDSLETPENAQEEQAESDAEQEEQPSPKVKPKKKQKEKVSKHQSAPTVVDDKFFKLREMHEFLEKEEKNPNGTVDDSIDLFADFPSSDDDEAEDPDDEEGESYGLHYKDFFDPVEGEEDGGDETESVEEGESGEDELLDEEEEEEEGDEGVSEDEDPSSNKKSVRFETGSNEESGESEVDEDVPKSSFEGRQERLQKRIDQIHDEALSKKPWQLQGEVKATTRPQNSLLEEVLEFDMTSRPAPVITEQTTLKLEDIIRQRIKDKVWDDVERKVKPVDTPKEFKKALVLDQEKSKLSLAQIYEKEYQEKQQAAQAEIDGDIAETQQEEDSPAHVEIKKLMHSLFCKLDALSNYHYTPKLAQPEIKVISNLPAITVEEVGPAGTSDATLLAPGEVKAKRRGTLLGKDERTSTDKKRERRKKKKKQRVHKLRQEAKEKERQKKNPQEESKKMSKKQAAKHVEKAAKEGTIKMMKDSGSSSKAVKSSTAFFSQLQDQVTSVIKNKSMEMKRKKETESNFNIKKLKMVK